MRVLVISRDPTLASMLENSGQEVIDARPGDAQAWGESATPPDCDAAVLHLQAVSDAPRLLGSLRSGEPAKRVVAIREESDQLPADVVVLQEPVSAQSILEALGPQTVVLDPPSEPGDDDMEIRRVRRAAEQAMSLEELSDALAAEAVERIGAEGLALLLPYGDNYRVHGGARLRQIEQRMAIPPTHWLITHLLQHTRGAVIEHTDITRSQLRGAPLAAMDYMVIVTRSTLGLVVVAGRDSKPFARRDLALLDAAVRETEPMFRRSLKLRDLAVALQRFLS